jgi:hypothetical protein
MLRIQRWRVHCETDGRFVYTWGGSRPTICPEDPSQDIVDADTVSVGPREGIDVISNPSMESVLPGASIVVAFFLEVQGV